MICKNCSEEIQEGWKNCPKCGCKLEVREEEKYVFFPTLKGKTRININLAFRIISIIVGIFSAIMIILHIYGEIKADENYKLLLYIIRFINTCGIYLVIGFVFEEVCEMMEKKGNPNVKIYSNMKILILEMMYICIVVIAGLLLVLPSDGQKLLMLGAVANDSFIDYLSIVKEPVILFVFAIILKCIMESMLDRKFMSEHIVRFYQDVVESGELQQNEFWKPVQDAYCKHIHGSALEPYCLQSIQDMTYEASKVYRSIVRKCVKKFKRDVDILFAIVEDRGMLMTEEGLFLYDCLIPNESVESILLYRNVIFINRIAFELNSEQEADILFRFLTFLYPQVFSRRENHMEETVEKLQGLEDKKNSDSGKVYFHKCRLYKDNVAQMVEEYIGCYLKLHPETQYNRYQKEMQRLKILHRIMLGIQVILLLILLQKLDLWGFLVSGGICFVYYVIYFTIETYIENFLPEELVKLLNESKRCEGTLNLLEYRNTVNEMRKQILGADTDKPLVRYCTKCGKPLEKTWISCPFCGDE